MNQPNNNNVFLLSVPVSYLVVMYILIGTGYIEYLIRGMGDTALTTYGQLSIIFIAGTILLGIIALLLFYLGSFRIAGYSLGLGIILYGLSKAFIALNSGIPISFEVKSPLVLFILLILTGILFIVTSYKIEEDKSKLFGFLSILFFLASWLYIGYLNYVHFDPSDIYGILRGSLITSLKLSFIEPIYLFLGGPFFPLVVIGILPSFVALLRGADAYESKFIRTSCLFSVSLVLFGIYISSYLNINSLLISIADLVNVPSFDLIALYYFALAIGLLFYLIVSLVSVFNVLGVGIEYKLPVETERPIERERIGIVAREEEEEGIEEISLEDLDLDL